MKILRIPLVIVLLVLAGRAVNADAQTETNLYTFAGHPNDGEQPYGGLDASGPQLGPQELGATGHEQSRSGTDDSKPVAGEGVDGQRL